MHAVFDNIVMIDGSAGIDDHKAAYLAPGIDNNTGHYHRALPDRDIRGDDSARMDRFGKTPALLEDKQGELPPDPRVAESDEHAVSGKKFLFLQTSAVTQNRNFVNDRARWPVIEKPRQRRARHLEGIGDYPPVAPAAEDYDRPSA